MTTRSRKYQSEIQNQTSTISNHMTTRSRKYQSEFQKYQYSSAGNGILEMEKFSYKNYKNIFTLFMFHTIN